MFLSLIYTIYLVILLTYGNIKTRYLFNYNSMEHLKEDFLKTYSNIPLNLRDDIVLVLEDKRPISWDVAFFEIKNDTGLSKQILIELKKLELI